MDLHRLRLICEVADRGSLSAAASALSYSTSSVSGQIAVLERGARGVRLTAAGSLVVGRARELIAGVAAPRAELDDLAGLRAGRLHLGAFPTAGVRLLPRAVGAFRARHPDRGGRAAHRRAPRRSSGSSRRVRSPAAPESRELGDGARREPPFG